MPMHDPGSVRRVVLIACITITSNLFLAAAESEGGNEIYGVYQVASTERYRGGLTSENEARELVGTSVVISDDRFVYRGKDVADPVYRIECVPASLGGGSVDSRGLSSFYGFLPDREEVCLLRVSDSGGEFVWEFEIINSEMLWDLYDGWIFELMKTPQ